jgi:hypothetical protein
MTPPQNKCERVLDGPPPTLNIHLCWAPRLQALNTFCQASNDKGHVLLATAGDALCDGEAAKSRCGVLSDIALLVPTKDFHQATHN